MVLNKDKATLFLRDNLYLIYIVCLSVVFWLQNRAVPFFSDDNAWTNVLPHKSIWEDIFQWFKTLSLEPTSCGRFTCHILVQLLIPFGELWFDTVNAIFFCLTMYYLGKVCFPKYYKSLFPYAIITIALMYFCPSSETLFYWGSGSANYLFPLFLILLYIQIIKHFDTYSWPLCFLYSGLSFFIGWTHEIFVLPISCSLIVYYLINRNRISKKSLTVFICFLLGSFWLVLSPGSINRFLGQESVSQSSLNFIVSHSINGLKMFRDGRWMYVFLLFMCYLLVLRKYSFKGLLKKYYFILTAISSSFIMLLILRHGGRAVLGLEIFSLIFVCRFLEDHILFTKRFRILCGIFCFFLLSHQILLVNSFNEAWRTYRIAEQKANEVGPNQTIPIEDWQSSFFIINHFVAHPYQMMMKDKWMRIPNCHSFCRSDIYEWLNSSTQFIREFKRFDDVWIIQVENQFNKKLYYLKLAPISLSTDGNLISNIWHMSLSSIMPSRYPSMIRASQDDVIELCINGNYYQLIKKPFCPIYRDIENIIEK